MYFVVQLSRKKNQLKKPKMNGAQAHAISILNVSSVQCSVCVSMCVCVSLNYA